MQYLIMVELCLVAFCKVDNSGGGFPIIPFGNGYGCGKDALFSMAAAVCGLG